MGSNNYQCKYHRKFIVLDHQHILTVALWIIYNDFPSIVEFIRSLSKILPPMNDIVQVQEVFPGSCSFCALVVRIDVRVGNVHITTCTME